MKKLLEKGCIEKVSTRPKLINPLSVVIKNNKSRMIIDLSRCPNKVLKDKKFKMEDLRFVSENIRKDDYMTVMDLKSAYNHLRIHPSDYELSGFEWLIDGEIVWFHFTVLPFGLAPAAHVLTRLIKILMIEI